MSDNTKKVLEDLQKKVAALEEKAPDIPYTRCYIATGYDEEANITIFMSHTYMPGKTTYHRHSHIVKGDDQTKAARLALHSLFQSMLYTTAGTQVEVTIDNADLITLFSSPAPIGDELLDEIKDEMYAIGVPVVFERPGDSVLFKKAITDIVTIYFANRPQEDNADSDRSSVHSPGSDSSEATN